MRVVTSVNFFHPSDGWWTTRPTGVRSFFHEQYHVPTCGPCLSVFPCSGIFWFCLHLHCTRRPLSLPLTSPPHAPPSPASRLTCPHPCRCPFTAGLLPTTSQPTNLRARSSSDGVHQRERGVHQRKRGFQASGGGHRPLHRW
jgi:hypothetical protein